MKAECSRCGRRWWFDSVFVAFLFLAVVASAQRCTFPKDFSHRSPSLEAWLIRRGIAKVSDKWGDGKSWSKLHKLISSHGNASDWESSNSPENVEEFTKWVSGITRIPSSPEQYAVAYEERPLWKSGGPLLLSSFAVTDLKEDGTILDVPVGRLISDQWKREDPKSLRDAPWEIRVAAKLLRERSRADQSPWASYIKLLPNFLTLPLFFSNLELNNVQDRTIESEVLWLRKHVKAMYQALQPKELSGAKFSEFAWALSVTYSSACQVDRSDTGAGSSHFLMPFFSSTLGTRSRVHAKYENEGLKLVSHGVSGGTPLAAEYASSTMRDTFIFRGYVPKLNQQDNIRVFRDLLDLVDWYASTHGAVNNNRYLTWRIARDAINTLAGYLPQQEATSLDSWKPSAADFSIGANGFVDHHMTSIFATLSYAKQALGKDTGVEPVTIVDLTVRNGTTAFERVMQSIAKETVSRYMWRMMDCKGSSESSLEFAFKSAKSILLRRLVTMLESFPTNLAEDQALLEVAGWEGMNELEGDQLACPSCRWQTEQMSYHDNLALQFRFSIKTFLSELISAVSCGANLTRNVTSTERKDRTAEETDSLQKFQEWCAEHHLIISEKLAITDVLVPAQDEFSTAARVRGVVASEDIHQGETLSLLPMAVGLFNNDSVRDNIAADAWDYAAARLLREKAKGNESDWAPYIAILPDYLPTPIHLGSRELMEVQWWPVIRELVQVRKAIRESFTKLSQNELALANYSEYKWAVTMVHSRAFTLPVKRNEQYEQYVLMPFMDMINHHYHYKADWMSQPVWDGKLEIVAKRTVKKGEELFASFGPRSNDNLFLYYGFVLKDNPFDTVPLFGSFQEALRWFKNTWTRDCVELMGNQLEASRCQQKTWQNFRYRMKDSIEEAETGSGAQGREWGELVNQWADLGFQFLPYQPGPTVYPGGIVDPSFLAVLSSSFEVLDSMRKESGVDSPWPDHCPECGNHSAVGSSVMRKFFRCIEQQPVPISGLLDGLTCGPELTSVFLKEEKLTRAMLSARISVVLRCREILASFPTTIAEDRELLEASVDTCSNEASACGSAETTNGHLHLTWRYRYMKKLILRTPVDKLLN